MGNLYANLAKDNSTNQNCVALLVCLFLLFIPVTSFSQTEKFNQNWNEISFTRHIKDKWTAEFNVGNTFTSTLENNNPFEKIAQITARGWIHYYYSSRWKFSFFTAYYDNFEIPETNQTSSTEWRFAPQGIYYINKIDYVLSTRMRLEARFIENNNSDKYENGLRYRQQIKYLKPINSKIIREGVFYGIVSEEVYFKLKSQLYDFGFDRNRFAIGGGYAITDDVQIELTYINEFLPRDSGNEVYNAISMNLSFNNLYKKLIKKNKAEENKMPIEPTNQAE